MAHFVVDLSGIGEMLLRDFADLTLPHHLQIVRKTKFPLPAELVVATWLPEIQLLLEMAEK
jgi:hypothetical protein